MNKSLTTKRFGWVVNLLAARNLIKSKRKLAEMLGTYSTKLSEILAERMYVSGEIIYQMSRLFPEIPYEFYFIELPSNNINTEDELRSLIEQNLDGKDTASRILSVNDRNINSKSDCRLSTVNTTKCSTLPLLPMSAIAGFNGIDEIGIAFEHCEQIDMPYLVKSGAEFLIRISGNSMQPNYHHGDLIACRRIKDMAFFQWGKVYLLDSEQGAMLKRVFPAQDQEMIECRSDNPDYPPFLLQKESIRSLSIVVALIREE